MKLFGRKFKLSIGNEKETIEIDNLKVEFEVQKSLTPEPNPAIVRVYNLNASHRNAILSKEFNLCELSVGYDELRQIFTGEIIESITRKENEDFITELTCGDGFTAYTARLVVQTLSSGKTDTDILKENAKRMGLDTGIADLPKDRALPRGKVLFGDARDIMNKIAKNHDADWSIQDSQLTLLPKNKVLADTEGFILSQETGMIGSPQKTDNGLQIFCLCNPHLRVGGLVRVQSISTEFNGDYKITQLSHSGDTLGDNWTSKIICIGGTFFKVEKR